MSALPKRENLRRLVELLPERDLEVVERVLEGLISLERDPVLAAFRNAPMDDEELSEEDIAALREADQAIAEGRVSSHEDVMRRMRR